MLLGPDRKKMASVIVGGMKPGYIQGVDEKSKDAPVKMGEGSDEDLNPKAVAAKAVLKAIKSDDPKRLAAAMSELISMCSGSEESYGEESDDYSKE